MDLEDGGATPVREDTAQEWWRDLSCHLINLFVWITLYDWHLLIEIVLAGKYFLLPTAISISSRLLKKFFWLLK